MDGSRRSDVTLEGSRTSVGSGTPTQSAPSTPPASSAPKSSARAPLSSRMSLAPDHGNSSGSAFAREAECGVCTKSFNLLRRRHHCRSCNIAVCKDCGRKAIDHRKGERSKPQWYCLSCIDADDDIEVAGAARASSSNHKRLSFSAPSYAPTMSPVTSLASHAKFCVECGYELSSRVKFCIECGTSVRPQVLSPAAGTRATSRSGDSSALDDSNRAPSRTSNLMIIDEHSDDALTDPLDGSEDDASVALPIDNNDASDAVAHGDLQQQQPPLNSNDSSSTDDNDALIQQLQVENDKLRQRIDKMKRKVVESDRQQQQLAAAHAQALAAAQAQATAVAQATASPATSSSSTNASIGVAVRDHPDFVKFFKLLSMGLPAEQVKMKMTQAGIDPSKLDTPDAIVGGSVNAVDAGATSAHSTVLLVKDDDRYAKFFKLLKMGMPSAQIQLKMQAEGLDPALLDTPDAPLPGAVAGGSTTQATQATQLTIKDDPAYAKFFKLLKMGMPLEQVKLKMQATGLNAALLETPDAASPNQQTTTTANGLLAGLPPPTAAVTVDPAALQASLAAKAPRTTTPVEPALPKKDAVKPSVELRPLFWTRVPVNVVSSTLWMKLDDAHATFDVDEIEWMFRKALPDKKSESIDAKKHKDAAVATPQTVLLLDPKRQQNVSIAIARFRMSASDIASAIYALDGKRLTSEILNVLISISPTLEEQDLLKNYDGDEKLLGNVEKFFLELLAIPRYTQRIKCFRYKLTFESRILETQAQLDTLVAATDQVSESDKFRRVLEHVLAVGNYLNGSTPRGGAYGFKLDTLTKLHTLRSIEPRVTLMHYLLRQLDEQSPEVIAMAGELPHVSEARRLSLDQLRADLSAYNTELAMLQGQVRASKTDRIEYDKFYDQMAPFAADAAEVLEELGRDFNALETSYHELVSSFGEDPRKVGPMEFFAILDEFVTEFKKAYRQNQTKEYQAIYETARDARQEAVRLAAEEAQREAEARHAESTKAVYAQVLAVLTAWAQAHASVTTTDEVVEQFKATSRRLGADEITSDEFCDAVRQLVGSKTTLKLLPDAAKLMMDPAKREELRAAHARFSDQVKREKELKKRTVAAFTAAAAAAPPSSTEQRPRGASTGKRRTRVAPAALQVDDIEPVVGEAAAQLHKSILESVQYAFGGDSKKMKVFTSTTRKYGSEQISAREFYQYLTASFEPDFVGRLVPDLARLLQDADKRHALIRALCESAPGWEKFSGL